MTNEEKAKRISGCDNCKACIKYNSEGSYCFDSTCGEYDDLMKAMNWKDEQFKEILETELKKWNGDSCEAKYRTEMLNELIEKINEKRR